MTEEKRGVRPGHTQWKQAPARWLPHRLDSSEMDPKSILGGKIHPAVLQTFSGSACSPRLASPFLKPSTSARLATNNHLLKVNELQTAISGFETHSRTQ
jgi:hypothetical protein